MSMQFAVSMHAALEKRTFNTRHRGALTKPLSLPGATYLGIGPASNVSEAPEKTVVGNGVGHGEQESWVGVVQEKDSQRWICRRVATHLCRTARTRITEPQ